MKIKDRRGKVALVTEGASGIGREIVLQLLGEGAHVVAADIDESALEALGVAFQSLCHCRG